MDESSLYVFSVVAALLLWLLILFRSKELRRVSSVKTLTDTITTLPNQHRTFSPNSMRATFSVWEFWRAEKIFMSLPWVIDVLGWCAGGEGLYPTYIDVIRWRTSHRLAIQIVYDPWQISYADLLEVFWGQIDPIDEWGQYIDRWFQFTTAIWYHTVEQLSLAEHTFEEKDSSWLYLMPIVTEILPYTTFVLFEEAILA